jgi:ADP-glucose pyrophosphorylase
MLVRERAAHGYDFGQNEVPGAGVRDAGYWRDLATLDAYFDAHMDLCAVHPGAALRAGGGPRFRGRRSLASAAPGNR